MNTNSKVYIVHTSFKPLDGIFNTGDRVIIESILRDHDFHSGCPNTNKNLIYKKGDFMDFKVKGKDNKYYQLLDFQRLLGTYFILPDLFKKI